MQVGILGLGDIGSAVATSLAQMGFQVTGYRRSAKRSLRGDGSLGAVVVDDDVARVLEESNYVVNMLPSTSETRGMLSGDRLQVCAGKKPCFINVGRGDICDEDSLLRALDNNWLSSAVLDVFPVEPLPASSSLWHHPRVHITPHVSALSLADDVAELFVANLLRLADDDQDLLYPVDWHRGY